MKKAHFIFISFLFLLISCNSKNTKSSETKEEVKTQKTEEKTGEVQSDDTNTSRKSISLTDKVAPLIQKHPFFAEMKDAKSGPQNGAKVIVTSGCEYIEQDAAELLDGRAFIKLTGMGFGSKVSANFKAGKLHGNAYRSFSAPGSYVLLMKFDNDVLQEASFYTQDFDTCKRYGPLKGKSLKELDAEFDNILKSGDTYSRKFKDAECPAEMNDIYK
jgi:hypothetical protein